MTEHPFSTVLLAKYTHQPTGHKFSLMRDETGARNRCRSYSRGLYGTSCEISGTIGTVAPYRSIIQIHGASNYHRDISFLSWYGRTTIKNFQHWSSLWRNLATPFIISAAFMLGLSSLRCTLQTGLWYANRIMTESAHQNRTRTSLVSIRFCDEVFPWELYTVIDQSKIKTALIQLFAEGSTEELALSHLIFQIVKKLRVRIGKGGWTKGSSYFWRQMLQLGIWGFGGEGGRRALGKWSWRVWRWLWTRPGKLSSVSFIGLGATPNHSASINTRDVISFGVDLPQWRWLSEFSILPRNY